MVIDADQPTITQKRDVNVQMNYFSSQELQFQNRLGMRTVFEFASSRPDLVRPNQDAITFESRESKLIRLDFAPQNKYGTADVFLFANDLEYNAVECY